MLRLLCAVVRALCVSPRTGRGRYAVDRRRRVSVVAAIVYLQTFCFLHRTVSSAVALGASIICNKIPGLAPKQRTICQGHSLHFTPLHCFSFIHAKHERRQHNNDNIV